MSCIILEEKKATRWWHGFMKKSEPANTGPQYHKLNNDNCGTMLSKNVSCSEFSIANDKNSNFEHMRLIFGGSSGNGASKIKFVKEAIARSKNAANGDMIEPTENFVVDGFEASCCNLDFLKEREDQRKISIDGDWHQFNNNLKLKFVPRAFSYFVLN